MPSVIVRPDLPVQLYPLRSRIRVPRTATPWQLERAIREQGGTFVRYVAKDGYEWRSEYGMKIVGGPYPPIRPKALPKPIPHGKLQPGPHERKLDSRDTSYTVELQPMAIADEWEWEVQAFFTRPAIAVEVLEDDLRSTHGR